MSYNITSDALSPSEEVEAYPLVLKLCAIDWNELAINNPDSDRIRAFALASAFCEIVYEDLVVCKSIAKVSGIPQSCVKIGNQTQFLRPINY